VYSPAATVSDAQKDFYAFDDAEEEFTPEEVNSFLLWDTKQNVWEVFKVLRLYETEMGGLPTDLLLRYIDERKLPFEETVEDLPYIYYGYLIEKQRITKD